jgi:hypothetical protein
MGVIQAQAPLGQLPGTGLARDGNRDNFRVAGRSFPDRSVIGSLREYGVKLPTGGFQMLQTVEAMIDETGNVRLLEPLHLSSTHRALVTILDEIHPIAAPETALLSEPALAADWNRPEEDAAWSHLQRVS